MNFKKIKETLNKGLLRWEEISIKALPIVEEAVEFRKSPGLLSGARMAMRLKDHLLDLIESDEFEEVEPVEPTFDQDSKLEPACYGIGGTFMVAQLKTLPHKLVKKYEGSDCYWTLIVEGCEFYLYKQNPKVDIIYVRKTDEEAKRLLRDIAWKSIGSCILLDYDNDTNVWSLDGIPENKSYETELSRRYTEEVQAYKKAGYNRSLLFYGPPGCHRKGQKIIMFDGSLKKVEDVQVGDQLMGPDQTPRNVLQLCRGVDKMVEIKPDDGKPWVVNQNHILTLGDSDGNLIDISFKDYSKWSLSQQYSYSLVRVNPNLSKNDFIKVGFDYKLLPREQYYGFVLDKDHRYLLDDFTITHNTGKSNCSAQILKNCVQRVLVIASVQHLHIKVFNGIFSFLKPDAVLLEDIDHCVSANLNHFLTIMEKINKNGVTVVATCNKVGNLDDALIRAGRFDELIEVRSLSEEVVRQLIGDEDIFKVVKEFPIAAILEVKRRYEVFGKERTLEKMADLEIRVKRSASRQEYRLEYEDEIDNDEDEE